MKPYVSPKLDVKTAVSLDDTGFIETAEHYLKAPFSECSPFITDFGAVARKRNKVRLFPDAVTIRFGKMSQTLGACLDENKPYLISELFLALNPTARTQMSSHEYEIYELIKLISGDITYIEHNKQIPENTALVSGKHRTVHKEGDMFLSVCSDLFGQMPSGFYHRLENISEDTISLAHILLIAERELAMKDGKLMRYGFIKNCVVYMLVICNSLSV